MCVRMRNNDDRHRFVATAKRVRQSHTNDTHVCRIECALCTHTEIASFVRFFHVAEHIMNCIDAEKKSSRFGRVVDTIADAPPAALSEDFEDDRRENVRLEYYRMQYKPHRTHE